MMIDLIMQICLQNIIGINQVTLVKFSEYTMINMNFSLYYLFYSDANSTISGVRVYDTTEVYRKFTYMYKIV